MRERMRTPRVPLVANPTQVYFRRIDDRLITTAYLSDVPRVGEMVTLEDGGETVVYRVLRVAWHIVSMRAPAGVAAFVTLALHIETDQSGFAAHA